jgi:hypothetical protein
MGWTTPRTWVPGEPITAALWNAHIRDNLLETEAAKATSDGQLLMATGANGVAMRKPKIDVATAAVTTTSTTPTTLGSGTPSVTFTHGGSFEIWFNAQMRVSAGTADLIYCAPDVTSGPSATIHRSIQHGRTDFLRVGGHVMHYGLTPGSVTVKLMYWCGLAATTGEWSNRSIIVQPY